MGVALCNEEQKIAKQIDGGKEREAGVERLENWGEEQRLRAERAGSGAFDKVSAVLKRCCKLRGAEHASCLTERESKRTDRYVPPLPPPPLIASL